MVAIVAKRVGCGGRIEYESRQARDDAQESPRSPNPALAVDPGTAR